MTTALTKPENSTSLERPAATVTSVFTQPLPELAKALATAISKCHAVEKDATNTFHKYDYASAEAIIEEGRKALAAAGLVLLPVEASLNGTEREGPDRFELVRTFRLLHVSGESAPLRVAWPVVPDRGRPLDKATAAADTLSLSYLLRDLLLMPRVDRADDVNARDDRPKSAKQQQPTKKQPADGAELEQMLNRRDSDLSKRGLCREGEFKEYILVWARETRNCDLPLPRWPTDLISSAVEEARKRKTFLENAKANAQKQKEIGEMLARKGKTWRDVQRELPWAANLAQTDLLIGQYETIMATLEQEWDAEPAGRTA